MKTRTTLNLSILLSALFFAAPVTNGKTRGGGGDADAHRRKGIELFDAKQFAEAIQEFDKAVQAAPDAPTAYRDRGTAYRGAGGAAERAGDGGGAGANRNLQNVQAAIEDYGALLQKNPANEDALVKRGATYAAMMDYEKAIADYQAALKIKPDDYDTVQRMQYAQAQLAAKNAPPATPTPTPRTSIFTPAKIFFRFVILVIIAVVVRLITRGKPEEISSSRIR